MYALIGTIGIMLAALVFVVHAVCTAPEGYEDEQGFHLMRPNTPTGAVLKRTTRTAAVLNSGKRALDLDLAAGNHAKS